MKSAKLGGDLQKLSLRPVPEITKIPSSDSDQDSSAASTTYKRRLTESGLPDISILSKDKEIIVRPLKVCTYITLN